MRKSGWLPEWWGFGLIIAFVIIACTAGPTLVCTHHDCF